MNVVRYDRKFELCKQWAIAEDLRISGESDGYDGTKPQHPDVDYLQGYVEGCRRKLAEVNALLAEFQKETADPDSRIRDHRLGRGSRLCAVAKERGIPFTVASD